ncbi:15771_t:CDS:2, partial [Acaulospora colombiana]
SAVAEVVRGHTPHQPGQGGGAGPFANGHKPERVTVRRRALSTCVLATAAEGREYGGGGVDPNEPGTLLMLGANACGHGFIGNRESVASSFPSALPSQSHRLDAELALYCDLSSWPRELGTRYFFFISFSVFCTREISDVACPVGGRNPDAMNQCRDEKVNRPTHRRAGIIALDPIGVFAFCLMGLLRYASVVNEGELVKGERGAEGRNSDQGEMIMMTQAHSTQTVF